LAESIGDTQRAIAYYRRLSNEFPSDSRAADALFNAGLDAYRVADFTTAAELFTATATMPANTQPDRSNFWVGKTYQAAGDAESASTAFQNAVITSGGHYYGLRADEVVA